MDRRFIVGCIIALLGGLSSVVLFSVSQHDAVSQLSFALMGVVSYIGVLCIPRRVIQACIPLAYITVVLLLILTYVLGHTAKGAQRWFSIGPVRIQVSELAKPVLALSLSAFAIHYPLRSQRRIALFFSLAAPIVGAVLLQPDLGSSLVLLVITISIAVFASSRLTLLLPWVILAILGIAFAWQFVLYPYQKERIFSFLGKSDSASSYNAEQAIITVGSGKLWGRGIGHGVQTSLRFLPEHHTDFFFASFTEEVGLLGALCLIAVYIILLSLLFVPIGELAPFDQFLRFSVFSGILFQAAVHIAMNIGLSPVTGIPLPFLSSGGSSFVSLSLFVGLALRFSRPGKHTGESIADLAKN